jgi:hypothetical protein
VRDSDSNREKNTRKLYEELSSISIDSLSESFSRITDRIKEARVKSIAGADMSPMMDIENRVIVVPSTLKDDISGFGPALLRFAQFLKFDIREFRYEVNAVKMADAVNIDSGTSLFRSLDDVTTSVRVLGKKNNEHERMRSFVRAQQIIGFVSDYGQGPEILARNHFYFGNNSTEVTEVETTGKKHITTRVTYFKDDLTKYWKELQFGKLLTEIFIKLIRMSWRAIDPDIMFKNVVDCVIPYADLVQLYCAVPTEETVGRGKTEIHHRVVSKPKTNNMLLPEEQLILNEISASIFGKTYFEENPGEWSETLLKNGFKRVKSHLQDIYKVRGEYVRAFSNVTTKRLGQLRTLGSEYRLKKKKDVKSEDLSRLILSRSDPISVFTDEIVSLDHLHKGCLAAWMSGLNTSTEVAEVPSSDDVKHYVADFLVSRNTYTQLERAADQVSTWNDYFNKLDNTRALRADALFELLDKLRKEAKPRQPITKKRFLVTELMAIQANQNMRGKDKAKAAIVIPKPSDAKLATLVSVAPPLQEQIEEIKLQNEAAAAIDKASKEFAKKQIPLFLKNVVEKLVTFQFKHMTVDAKYSIGDKRSNPLYAARDSEALKKELSNCMKFHWTEKSEIPNLNSNDYVTNPTIAGRAVAEFVVGQYNLLRKEFQPEIVLK